jgi:hypothetical protein
VIGIRNGFPNDLILHKFVNKIINPNNIPIIPRNEAVIISKYLYSLTNDWNSWYEKNIEHIAVIATTITIIGDIIPADTAASPSTNAPNIDKDVPREEGFNASASYKISNVNINNNASIKAGNGTVYLCKVKVTKRLVGSIC